MIAWLVVAASHGADPAAALTGREVYEQACASCHGADGRGAPAGTSLTVVLPDFTDCTIATSETTANWAGLVRHGGPFLGLSPQMPQFGDALTEAEVIAVIAYVRDFCGDRRYPLGDLNFRRPVFVGKAFPEDEVVLGFEAAQGHRERELAYEIELEKRIGPRGWIETALPVGVVDATAQPLRAGVGDVSVAYHHILMAVPDWRAILSAGLGLGLPTGNRRHGVGAGTPVVTPELRAGRALGPFVLQTQVLASLPGDSTRAERQMLYRLALQAPLCPYKKCIVPAIELEQSQALDAAVHAATLLAPALYLPLSRRGHVALGVAGELPVAGTRPFDWRLGAFLLWEYADGPFWSW